MITQSIKPPERTLLQTNLDGSVGLTIGEALRLAVALRRGRHGAANLVASGQYHPAVVDDPDDDDGHGTSEPLELHPAIAQASIVSGLPAIGRLSSGFGLRWHPIDKVWKAHKGVDVAAPIGTTITATGAGTVSFSGWRNGYGKCVVIDHGGGVETLCGHMNALYVTRGESVVWQQAIGEVGSTGKSTGPHVHYEVRQKGVPIDPIG